MDAKKYKYSIMKCKVQFQKENIFVNLLVCVYNFLVEQLRTV